MEFKIHTPYNYSPRRESWLIDEVTVDVCDTSVDNVRNNISISAQSSSNSFYTNSDVPVSLFGPGITSTHYDPMRHRGSFSPQSQPAAAAAAAPSNSVAANSAANAAATSASQSNAATITNS